MIANHGVVSCCGNVAGASFESSVFPFILRGIQLSGIDSAESSIDLKKDLWELLSNEWSLILQIKPKLVKISEIKEEIDKILKGEQIGRVVIQHGGINMKDDYKEYYESEEANLDSKSDAKVILFLIIVAVIAMTYWVAVQ